MSVDLTTISKSFGRKIFEDFSLHISDGEFLGIKGESGSGKTTLLNIIGAIEEVDAGKVRINDFDYTHLTSDKQRRLYKNQISFVFQNFGLLENESVEKNLSLVLKINKIPAKEWKEKVDAVLKQVNLDYLDSHLKPHSLSGGEQQRVALARTILSDNPIILADEPTGSLDEKNGDLVMALLKQLNKAGKTIVVVTHTAKYDALFTSIVQIGRS